MVFFFNETATTENYTYGHTLSLHDALPSSREYLEPVRFLGNRSSGRQGIALARTAAARGAEVTLVAANVTLPAPAGVKVVEVSTTAELREAVVSEIGRAHV